LPCQEEAQLEPGGHAVVTHDADELPADRARADTELARDGLVLETRGEQPTQILILLGGLRSAVRHPRAVRAQRDGAAPEAVEQQGEGIEQGTMAMSSPTSVHDLKDTLQFVEDTRRWSAKFFESDSHLFCRYRGIRRRDAPIAHSAQAEHH
jgi:hypothetical protein